MTADPQSPSPGRPQHWARLRPQDHGRYPAGYHRKWFRVVQRSDPAVPSLPGYMWLDMIGKFQSVWINHFEIAERDGQ